MEIGDLIEHMTLDLRRRMELSPVNEREAEAIMAAVPASQPQEVRVQHGLAAFRQRSANRSTTTIDLHVYWGGRVTNPSELFAHGSIAAQVTAVLVFMELNEGLTF
jgi:hypothetical protein